MTTTDDDDSLRDLGKQLPVDRPSADRRDALRSQLIASAAQPIASSPRRWLFVGAGFAAGALAAAAVAIVVVRAHETGAASQGEPVTAPSYARIESSTGAQLEHVVTPSPTGSDEVVRVHAGTIRVAVPPTRAGDRVRVATADAEIEGSGAYEVIATNEHLTAVTVTSGTANVRVTGQPQPVFLAAGQSWRAPVQTAALDLAPLPPVPPRPDSGQKGSDPISAAGQTGTDPVPAPPPRVVTSATPRTTRSGSPIETELEPPARPDSGQKGSDPISAPGRSASAPGSKTASGAPIETELRPAAETPARPARPAVTALATVPAPAPEKLATDAAVAPATPAVAPASSAIEQHFRAGWALLRANKLAEASVELGAAADAGDSPLAADARYYQAVALVKARRGAEAERALVQFLDRAPASIRRGRAAMMLGRLLADRGDREHARAWFEQAARDTDPAVAAAAKAELAAAPR